MTPALLNAYYNITNNTGTFAVSQAVYESDNQYMSPTDLSYFQSSFDIPQQAISRDYGGHADASSSECNYYTERCIEANLDYILWPLLKMSIIQLIFLVLIGCLIGY